VVYPLSDFKEILVSESTVHAGIYPPRHIELTSSATIWRQGLVFFKPL
jgi:hypothetical protein